MPVITPRLRLRRPLKGRSAFAPKGATIDRLSDLDGVRDNPGNLRGRFYVPEGLTGAVPLVVVLHGCTQDAAVYDHGSGWSTLADRHGFALLYPEQKRENNPMLCFNWFSGDHAQRGKGEAASIRAMIEAMKTRYAIDESQIFVTGLSAGGAMAAVMLATYPEVFAAGAIIAGIPFGCADSVGDAFECMNGRARNDAAALARQVRRASSHAGPWPRVQIWQGTADHTVSASNADSIARQWAQLHGLNGGPDRLDEVEGFPRRAWTGADGVALVEQYSITGMAHGVPLATGGDEPVGAAGAHMLDVGLSSTDGIAAFFGIAAERDAKAAVPLRRVKEPAAQPRVRQKSAGKPAQKLAEQARGPQAIIEKALRAAGLMR
ncbi:MAG TPA: PHB depolymerase family esterase [Allosphingosinicella sp.]|jgi:poly(hydroxyalkanoate) depolymerase family esterase